MLYGTKKDRSSAGTETSVKTKNNIVVDELGCSDSTAHLTEIQREWQIAHEAYHRGLLEGLSQGPTHPAVQQSVANFFGNWEGIEAAREQSINRFWEGRDAA